MTIEQKLADALRKIRCIPSMPFPCPSAHSERSFSDSVYLAWQNIQREAQQALAEHAAAKEALPAGARERLKRIETELKERGVKDIKFAFGDLDKKSLHEITSDVIDVLEHVVDGGLKDLPDIDYKLPKANEKALAAFDRWASEFHTMPLDDTELSLCEHIKTIRTALQAQQPEEITSIHDLGELLRETCLDFSERVILQDDQVRYIAKEILKRYPHGFKITGEK